MNNRVMKDCRVSHRAPTCSSFFFFFPLPFYLLHHHQVSSALAFSTFSFTSNNVMRNLLLNEKASLNQTLHQSQKEKKKKSENQTLLSESEVKDISSEHTRKSGGIH